MKKKPEIKVTVRKISLSKRALKKAAKQGTSIFSIGDPLGIRSLTPAKNTKKSTKVLPSAKLINWPPSRGPEPAWMKAKHEYEFEFEAPTIEMVEWLPPADMRRPYLRKPATLPKRVVTPAVKGQPRGPLKMVVGKTYKMTDLRAAKNTQRVWKIALCYDVDKMTTLQPEQWELIGGAVIDEYPAKYRKSLGRYCARQELYLPSDKALIVDLSYPMNKIARVTIKPYKTRWKGRDGKMRDDARMSVGYVLYQLACAYRSVYKQHEAYGVWGHAITDLCFEMLEIEDNIGKVSIGS